MSVIGRWLLTAYAKAALACVFGVVAMVLVVDFADRAYSFQGEGWVLEVAKLYLNLTAELAYQVSPAALLLAAGVAVSGLRQRGELTGLTSSGVSPGRVTAFVLGGCAAAACCVIVLNELIVVEASRNAERIKSERFRRAGDFETWFGARRWFRGREEEGSRLSRIYHVRGSEDHGALTKVTILELGPGFRLVTRIDAERLAPGEDGVATLEGVSLMRFEGGARLAAERHERLLLALPEKPEDFRVRAGRPRQLRIDELLSQIAVRRRLGLGDAEHRLELHGRLAYPLIALPGAWLAIRLALRRNRKGHLTAALAEGILVSLLVWTLLVVFRALGTGGTLGPSFAAWTPVAIVAAVATGAGLAQEWLWARPVPTRG